MSSIAYQTGVGRANSAQGAFYGQLDDIRIYNSALPLVTIGGVQMDNLVAIPELSTFAIHGGMLVLLFASLRRKPSRLRLSLD
jgi:hypothetical protein